MVAVNEDMIVIVERANSADTETHTVFIWFSFNYNQTCLFDLKYLNHKSIYSRQDFSLNSGIYPTMETALYSYNNYSTINGKQNIQY